MTKKKLSLLTSEELHTTIQQLSPEELGQQAVTVATEQLAILIGYLTEEQQDEWEKKLQHVTAMLPFSILEQVGALLNAHQLLALLEEELLATKLPTLLIGVNHTVFAELLQLISDEQLEQLKLESCTEALQHQMTLFSHQMAQELEIFLSYLCNLELEIESINPTTMNFQILEALFQLINTASHQALDNLHKIDNALALAWNASHEELIATLSFQKECWQKYLTLALGEIRHGDTPPSGLHAQLENHLNRVFADQNEEGIKTLHHNEPAIEALTKFSIWHLHDYWEIGLLPSITNPHNLDLETSRHTVTERFKYRAALLTEVQQQLQHLGLETVADLKRCQIYSKKMLIEYICKKQNSS